jgi:putative ABC transport system permease protein
MKKFFQSFPYQYHLRNLFGRKASTILNIVAIMVTVLVFLVMNGMAIGLKSSLQSTGREEAVVILTKGSQTAEVSKIPPNFFLILRYFPEIAKRSDGNPMLSQEVYTVKPLAPKGGGPNRRWIPIRGIDPANFDLYRDLFQIQGRALQGNQEVLVGNLVRLKLGNLQIGDSIPLGRQMHKVVGFFTAGGSAFESELWVTRNDLKVDYDMNYDSIGVVRFNDLKDRDSFIDRAENDRRLRLDLKTEREYFSSLSENANVLQLIAAIIAAILSVAAIFTGMNALYASVSARTTEIGTLRSMGFGRGQILVGFMFEGVMIALLAGLLSVLFSLPFEHLPIAYMRSSFRIRIPFSLILKDYSFPSPWFSGILHPLPPSGEDENRSGPR